MTDKDKPSDSEFVRWIEWIKQCILDLKDLTKKQAGEITDLYKLVTELRIEQAAQKVKTGIYGFIGAAIPVLLAIVIDMWKKK